MLQEIAPNLWHLQHEFKVLGVTATTRMTVVRFDDGRLWLHSPVPLSTPVREQLAGLGKVAFIVAPSKMHHLFAGDRGACLPRRAAVRRARPGQKAPRPGAAAHPRTGIEAAWANDLDRVHQGPAGL